MKSSRPLALALLGGALGGTLVACAMSASPPGTGPADSPAAPSGQILALVGEESITDRELERRILERYYGRRSLLGLVRESLFRQEARRLKVEPTPEEVDMQVEEEIQRVTGGTLEGRRRYRDELRRNGLTLDDVRKDLRAEFANRLLVERVVQGLRVVREGEIQALYQQTYRQPRVRVRHIAIEFEGAGAKDPREVDRCEREAKSLAERLRRGESFEELARVHSANEVTAERGGLIGVVNAESLGDETLAETVFGLAENEVSEPIREGDYGFHIFLVEKKLPARLLEEVRDELTEQLEKRGASLEEISEVEDRLRRRMTVTIFDEDL